MAVDCVAQFLSACAAGLNRRDIRKGMQSLKAIRDDTQAAFQGIPA
jgi:hypothetical protein